MNHPLDLEELTRFYPVLAGLPGPMLRGLLASGRPVQAAAGEVLVDPQTAIHSFLLITQGIVRVISTGPERELLLYRIRPGGCCAISICHLLGFARYGVRVEAESPVRGIAIPQAFFHELMACSPEFNRFVLSAFSGQFSEVIDLVQRLTSMRLDGRLARLLANRGRLVYATHSQLADELGSVREVISRLLKDFEAQGLVRLRRGQIEVLDPEALRRIAVLGDPGH